MYPEVVVNVSPLPNALVIAFGAVLIFCVWQILVTVREIRAKGWPK